MPGFKGTDFEIELPAEFKDESTYAFAFRARSNFRPSLVVKTERLAGPTELPAYVGKQLANIKQLLADVAVVTEGPTEQGKLSAYTAVYDFGEAARRVRQKQRYLLLGDPWRVVTLTGTNLTETFGETEDLFEAIFRSFTPIEQARRGV